MEIWDLYDENRQPTGKTHERGPVLVCTIPDGYYHIVVNCWVKNSKGEYLVSQRAAHRPSYPLKWECTGGSVLAGESSRDGAVREIKEELGIDVSKENGKLIFSQKRDIINGKKYNDILDVWIFDYDGDSHIETAQTDEVAQAKWVTYDEFVTMIKNGETTPESEYFTELFK